MGTLLVDRMENNKDTHEHRRQYKWLLPMFVSLVAAFTFTLFSHIAFCEINSYANDARILYALIRGFLLVGVYRFAVAHGGSTLTLEVIGWGTLDIGSIWFGDDALKDRMYDLWHYEKVGYSVGGREVPRSKFWAGLIRFVLMLVELAFQTGGNALAAWIGWRFFYDNCSPLIIPTDAGQTTSNAGILEFFGVLFLTILVLSSLRWPKDTFAVPFGLFLAALTAACLRSSGGSFDWNNVWISAVQATLPSAGGRWMYVLTTIGGASAGALLVGVFYLAHRLWPGQRYIQIGRQDKQQM